MMFTGRVVSGKESVELGLANICVSDEELDQRTLDLALDIVKNSWHTLRGDKSLVNAGLNRHMQEGLDYERNSGIARDVVSPKVLEDSRFAYETSVEAVLVAQFNEKKAELDVDRAESAILEMQSTIEATRLRLEDHNITAPLAKKPPRLHWKRNGRTRLSRI